MSTSVSIEPIAAFNDNYIWLIKNAAGEAWVVDPGDAEPVQQALETQHLSLQGILITHWHPDHTGGVAALKERTGCLVWGPQSEKFTEVDHSVVEGDRVSLGDLVLEVLAVPGHTLDHIAYLGGGNLFCGDTLFVSGCGRVFEGTFPMMRASLEKLRELPDNTRVFCAHEYTAANLRFALAADPDNEALQQHSERCARLRDGGQPTVPSTLAVERATNPFLRWDDPVIAQHLRHVGRLEGASADDVFAALRGWKDSF